MAASGTLVTEILAPVGRVGFGDPGGVSMHQSLVVGKSPGKKLLATGCSDGGCGSFSALRRL